MDVVVGGLVWIRKDQVGPAAVAQLRQQLTVSRRVFRDFDDGSEPVVKLFDETETHIGIPRRHWADTTQIKHKYTWRVSLGQPIETTCLLEQTGQYAEQGVVVDHFVSRFQSAIDGVHSATSAPSLDDPVSILRNSGGILLAKPGFGKCLGIGTPVLMFDGNIKYVEDIVNGDIVMGPDSRGRIVGGITRGIGLLYRIVPVKGDPWVCNDSHVLTIVNTSTDEIVDISVNDFLERDVTWRGRSKLFQPDCISFQGADNHITIDPYFVGVWIGDGTKNLRQGIRVTTVDDEILNCLYDVAKEWGCDVRVTFQEARVPTYRVVTDMGEENPLLDEMRILFKDGLCIPHNYLTSDVSCRLELLAGLIDTDGSLASQGGTFEFVQKDTGVADGVAYLARSLGFRVTRRIKEVCGGFYHRLLISGDTSRIPTRIERKKASQRRQIKNALRTGFSIEPIGVGEYAGFSLDGDGRFLLGDFTVTHNTNTTIEIIHRLKRTAIVLVNKEFLLKQWVGRIAEFMPGAKVGVVQEDRCEFEGMDIVVAMVHSLARDDRRGGRYPVELYDHFGIMISDEVHRLAAESWAVLPMRFSALVRLGLSATPRRKDGTEDVFFKHLGPVSYTAKTKMMPAGVRISKFGGWVPPYIRLEDTKSTTVVSALCKLRDRTKIIVSETLAALNAAGRRKVMVLSHRLEHLEAIEEMVRRSKDCPKDLTVGHYVGQWFAPGAVEVLTPGNWDMNEAGRKKAISALHASISRREGGVGRIEKKSSWVDPWTEDFAEGKAHIVEIDPEIVRGWVDAKYWLLIPEGEMFEVVLEELTDDQIFDLAEKMDVRQERKRKMVEVKDEELHEAERAQLVLATFQMCAEGLDIPSIDTIGLATPEGDVEQAIGRGRRFCTPKSEGGKMSEEKCLHFCPWRWEGCKGKQPLVVFDVDDLGVSMSESRLRYRTKYYETEGDRVFWK